MADSIDTTPETQQADKASTPDTAGADKAAADKLSADAVKAASDKAASDKADADREAEIDKRAAAKATKLAEKLANEKLAEKELAAKTKADREKMDVLEAAKLDKADLQAKLDKMTADHAAATLRGELATAMIAKDVKPASEGAMSYIAAAVAKHTAAGLDTAAALAAVRKDEAFLFAAPQTQQLAKAAAVNTGGAAAGGSEREAPGDAPAGKQYRTKPPSEIDPKDSVALRESIMERHGFSINFAN